MNETDYVEDARNSLYRASLTFWAKQGNYPTQDVIAWFDDVLSKYKTIDHIPYNEPVWEGFYERFPIELPRDENGKVDPAALDQMTYLQRALITAQSAEVAHTCALGGGDDTWFDYLPAGINTLAKLQAEDWAHLFALYVNEVVSIPDEDERFDAESTFDEGHDFYIMDTTTPLLSFYLRYAS